MAYNPFSIKVLSGRGLNLNAATPSVKPKTVDKGIFIHRLLKLVGKAVNPLYLVVYPDNLGRVCKVTFFINGQGIVNVMLVPQAA